MHLLTTKDRTTMESDDAIKTEPLGDATYSPEDNKLRLYAYERLPREVWERLKGAGFVWAPKQGLIVAPMWTPARYDLLVELCGEVGDEATSVEERARFRADRFARYRENRERDAYAAAQRVETLKAGEDMVAHNDGRKAERLARKINGAMLHAVDMWSRQEYWKQRVPAVLAHASYKAQDPVRHRRIKGLESEERKYQAEVERAERLAEYWNAEEVGSKRAWQLANVDRSGAYDVLNKAAQWLEEVPAEIIQEAREKATESLERRAEHLRRWLDHTRVRLAYERELMEQGGGDMRERYAFAVGGTITTSRFRGESVILKVNKAAGKINSLTCTTPEGERHWRGSQCIIKVEEVRSYAEPKEGVEVPKVARIKVLPLCNYPSEDAVSMTEAEYKAIPERHREIRKYYNSQEAQWKQKATHRRYHAWIETPGSGWGGKSTYVHLSDKKTTPPPSTEPKPEPPTPTPTPEPMEERAEPTLAEVMQQAEASAPQPVPDTKAAPTLFDAFKEELKGGGVQVVVAPLLYTTPRDVAQRVAEYADIRPGDRVLEPSAGTGSLLGAMGGKMFATGEFHSSTDQKVVAVELEVGLCDKLRRDYPLTHVMCQDYLSTKAEELGGLFDRVVMNPPFNGGADIKHIRHALGMLKPGGRLVAICANGPRQREAFMNEAEHWEDLPDGTFKHAGTAVRTALFVINKEAAE